jgi:actin related protein 2/3 complex subunit 2
MILLNPSNQILKETVGAQINWDESEKREQIDVRLCDFDDVVYRVQIEAEKKNILQIHMNLPCYHKIADKGAKAAVARIYGTMVQEAPAGFDVSLQVDLTALPADQKGKDALVEKIGLLKTNTIGGIFDYYFSALLAGTAPEKPYEFNMRADTTVYFFPRDDRVIVIYAFDFEDKVDKAIAKVFMQEFAEAKRRIKNAPPVSWDFNPTRELNDIGINENRGVLGYCSFAILKSHVEKEKKEVVVATLQSFRNYIQYHIKCAKSYFHSRMRARAVALLKVLNRSKVEILEDKGMKTATGKTFKRRQ